MTVQSVATLVQLGRPQSTYRVDLDRVNRAQIKVLILGLLFFVISVAIAVIAARNQTVQGHAQGQLVATVAGVVFALAGLSGSIWAVVKLQREKEVYTIVHDNGFYLRTVHSEEVVRWEQIRESRRVPLSNVTEVSSGLVTHWLQRQLADAGAERLLVVVTDGRRLVLPGHLADYAGLLAAIERHVADAAGQGSAGAASTTS
ncbi:MAG: hypothetical protein U0935_06155 [Pirellulales bacterium]